MRQPPFFIAAILLSLPIIAPAQSTEISQRFQPVNGQWSITPDQIEAKAIDKIAIAQNAISIEGNYVFTFTFTRTAGNDAVSAILPIGATQCALEFGGWSGQAHGLSRVNGKPVNDPDNPTSVRPGSLINGKKYTVSASVSLTPPNAFIAVDLDQQSLVRFNGLISELSPNLAVRLHDMNQIGLAVGKNTAARFEQMTLQQTKLTTPPAKRPASKFDPIKGALTTKTFQGAAVLHLKGNESVAFHSTAKLVDGTIECDIASSTFSGLAFRGTDTDTYECLYLRPFNSGTAKHKYTVQYASHGVPGGDWRSLRSKFPGTYEAGADIQVDEWVKLKLVIRGDTLLAYINDEPKPVLTVNPLLGSKDGNRVGIWGWDTYVKNFTFVAE